MSTPRAELLDPTLKVPASDVRWYYMSEYYDGPTSGLAIFRDRIVRFCCFREDLPHQRIYVLQELSAEELAEEKRTKKKFERMVGTHGCFDEQGNLLPPFTGDEASRAQYFAEEPPDRYETPQPHQRPILAWFDTTHTLTLRCR